MSSVYATPAGKLLFIHVPKTGGGSVSRHLRPAFLRVFKSDRHESNRLFGVGLKHYHGPLLAQLLQDAPPDHAFMIVRHPVGRVVSEFKWQSRKATRFYRKWSFSTWLRHNLAAAARDPSVRDNHFRPQVEFEAFEPKVFQLEQGLDRCFEWVYQITGLPPPSVEIHHRRSRDTVIPVTAADLALITAFYRADFERYGYAVDAP